MQAGQESHVENKQDGKVDEDDVLALLPAPDC
jgi:hypothetical protein